VNHKEGNYVTYFKDTHIACLWEVHSSDNKIHHTSVSVTVPSPTVLQEMQEQPSYHPHDRNQIYLFMCVHARMCAYVHVCVVVAVIQCMHLVCWISNATDRYSEYTYCFFTSTLVTWMCLIVMCVFTLPVLFWNRILFDQLMYFDKFSLYLIFSNLIPKKDFPVCAMKGYGRSIGSLHGRIN
jgi:hypothetical protein